MENYRIFFSSLKSYYKGKKIISQIYLAFVHLLNMYKTHRTIFYFGQLLQLLKPIINSSWSNNSLKDFFVVVCSDGHSEKITAQWAWHGEVWETVGSHLSGGRELPLSHSPVLQGQTIRQLIFTAQNAIPFLKVSKHLHLLLISARDEDVWKA